ncbi:MAG: hypothetical protein ACTSXU_14350 [Promethearchaeota archaeon]
MQLGSVLVHPMYFSTIIHNIRAVEGALCFQDVPEDNSKIPYIKRSTTVVVGDVTTILSLEPI